MYAGRSSCFEKAIQESGDGMLIIPANPGSFAPPWDAAVEAGMPVVALNNDLPDSKRLALWARLHDGGQGGCRD